MNRRLFTLAAATTVVLLLTAATGYMGVKWASLVIGILWMSLWLFDALRSVIEYHRHARDYGRAVEQWKRENHICLNCGYDLRATPDRCPECGRMGAKRQA